MDYNDFYYFTLIAEHNGFSQAERRTGIPKSTLSRRIAKLEKHLGVALFHRSPHHLTLTSAGKTFYAHCRKTVRSASAAVESILALKEEPTGLIRISCHELIAQYYLTTVLVEFMDRYPQVRVELIATDRDIHPVREDMDVVITTHPVRNLPPDLIVKRIAEEELVPVTSPDLLQRFGEPHTLEDVSRYPVIANCADDARTCSLHGQPEETHTGHYWTLSPASGGSAVRVPVQPRFLCSDMRAQYHAALRSAGLAMLPVAFLHDAYANGWLCRVLPDWVGPRKTVHALLPPTKGMLPGVRALLDHLTEHLPQSMGVCRPGMGFTSGIIAAQSESLQQHFDGRPRQ
ncbi:LysR substrate-binding domain-containing protein [Desulfovibrio psychrotolerans]|uniref:LysR family transcriptional regulator n=1 Tax=Desulfovibrio psychrotolerans TaxID=415242 RepID=A0A7J0BQL1_9BACT|nr:LysR substrate-binding domain-containing protein [Desulfovibrio psychrotolerans]GFM36006.1 LysR family transcriptional regulator [Desulfovibrio psychrotolerans]